MNAERDHWTNDDLMLRDYVLRRLDEPTRRECQNHLDLCEVCRLRVRYEEEIAAAVRRHAAEQVRNQLRAGVAAKIQIPWPRIISIAAVIVIIAGVGVYNRWFYGIQTTPPAPPATEKRSKEESDLLKDEASDSRIARDEMTAEDEAPGSIVGDDAGRSRAPATDFHEANEKSDLRVDRDQPTRKPIEETPTLERVPPAGKKSAAIEITEEFAAARQTSVSPSRITVVLLPLQNELDSIQHFAEFDDSGRLVKLTLHVPDSLLHTPPDQVTTTPVSSDSVVLTIRSTVLRLRIDAEIGPDK